MSDILKRAREFPTTGMIEPKLGKQQADDFYSEPRVNWVAPTILYGLGNAADLASTELALRNQAIAEANPMMRGGLPQRAAMKLGATAAMTLADTQLQKHGHSGIAKAMRIGIPLVLGGVAANNYLNSKKR